jgi:hypothetical protein
MKTVFGGLFVFAGLIAGLLFFPTFGPIYPSGWDAA